MKITKDINIHNGKRKNISITDLFDDAMKSAFNLSDEEYDLLREKMTDGEIGIMINSNPTFSDRREMIKIRNKYLK